MRRSIPLALLVTVLVPALVTAQVPVGRGQVVNRPGSSLTPEFPPPTITEYHPKPTLVTPVHMVPRAKYPTVDFHGHPPRLTSKAVIDTVVAAMDRLNVSVIVNAPAGSGATLTQQLEAVKASGHANRFTMFTSIDFRNVGPGSGQKMAAQLEADVKAGATGVGEIMKDFGLAIKKADGTRLKLDDPELDAVWAMAAKLKIPVFIHVADPAPFWDPIDFNNERWLELSLYRNRRYQDRSLFPTFEELMTERDNMFARNPRTTWVVAHLGWHAQDLARLGRMFDRFPNLYSEVGAVLYDLGRQPRTAHNFLVKYQDRVLFGKDSFQPDEYPYYWRVFETEDEYFDYYRDYHAFWKMYGLGLPDTVLRKLYYGNAVKIIPGLPKDGLPH